MFFTDISSKIKKIFISLIFIFTFVTITVSGLLSEDLAIQGNYFEKNGDYEKALECYSQAASNSQNHIYKYDQMKMSLEYELGQYEEAEQTKKIINKKTSGDESCYKGSEFHGTFASGISLLNYNKLDEAVEKFKKALDYCPFDTETQILIGYLRAKKENNEVALKYLENQKLISGILWKQKGDLLRDMLRIEEAKEAYQEALKREPELDEAKKELNKLNKDPQESSKNLQTPSQEENYLSSNKEGHLPTNPSLSPSISKNDERTNPSPYQQQPIKKPQNPDRELKEISFRETFDEIPVPPEAVEWNQKGVEAYNQENITYAIDCFDKALDIYPQYATAWKNKGLAYAKNEQYIESIKTYLFVIRTIDDSDAGVYNNLGYSYYYSSEKFSPDEKKSILAQSSNSFNLALKNTENSEEISIISENIKVVENKRNGLIIAEESNENIIENAYLILVFSGVICLCYILWNVLNSYYDRKEIERKEEVKKRLKSEDNIKEILKEKNEVKPIPHLTKKK